MTKILQLELPDEAYDALVQLAQGSGQLPEQMVAEWILSAGHMITDVSSSSLHSRTRRSAAAPRTPVAAQNDGATSSSHSKPTLASASYALKITLLESKPAIWRRVQAPANITLIKLHQALSVLMGWQDYHRQQFAVNGTLYGSASATGRTRHPELQEEG